MTDKKKAEIVGFDLELLYAVTQSQSADDLRGVAAKFCEAHGFSRWIYGLAGPDKVLTNYPAEWLASYTKNRWHRGRDPVVNAMNHRRRSVAWDLRHAQPLGLPLDAVEKSVLAERWEAGVRAGVTAPVYDRPGHPVDYAVVSFSRETPLTETEQRHHEPCVQLFATYFQSVAPTVLLGPDQRNVPAPVALSPREHSCLSWAARGKSSWEIGMLLTISVATVNFHLTNAARKLGVRGRTLAVARAIRLGLIDPL